MRARDFVQPLAQEPAQRSIGEILTWLQSGVPVAYQDAAGWRYVRPIDAVAAPDTRQLCDVPSVPLATVDASTELDFEQLASHELLGVTSGERLVGAIHCHEILVQSAKLANGDAAALLALSVRERLMPRLLHDLGNALTVGALVRGSTDDEDADGIAKAVAHAADLVRNMRRLYASQPTPPALFDLPALGRRLEPMLRLAARPSQLVLTTEGKAEIHGEAWRLERVLLNLVLNASEASERGRVQVDVASHGGQAHITVDDDGPGFTLRPSSDPGLRGHGLGVVRRQIALLAGEVFVSTSPLGGARVRIALPVAD